MNEIVSALHFATGLFAMWVLYFICLREYKVDAFRQKLFAVRDELFDYARSGKIAFDDPGYTTLRNLMNALLRFTHRLTFARMIVLLISTKNDSPSPIEAWRRDIARLP